MAKLRDTPALLSHGSVVQFPHASTPFSVLDRLDFGGDHRFGELRISLRSVDAWGGVVWRACGRRIDYLTAIIDRVCGGLYKRPRALVSRRRCLARSVQCIAVDHDDPETGSSCDACEATCRSRRDHRPV